jgi:hypothetical protein
MFQITGIQGFDRKTKQVSTNFGGNPIVLNQGNNQSVVYVPSEDISENKTFQIINVTGAKEFRIRFTLTDLWVLTWPANFFMSDARWNAGTKEWTPDDAGDFEAIGTYDGTNWFLVINGPYD